MSGRLLGGRVMVLVAHPDDEVLGAGGTIHRIADDAEVSVVIVNPGAAMERRGTTREYVDELIDSAGDAAVILGVRKLVVGPFRDVELSNRSVQIRDVHHFVEDCISELKPDVVISHSGVETHKDHLILHETAKVAVRPNNGARIGLLQFAPIGLYPNGFVPTMYVSLSEQDIEAKEAALMCYYGEVHKHTTGWRSIRAVRGRAVVSGLECGAEYAEAFRVERWYV